MKLVFTAGSPGARADPYTDQNKGGFQSQREVLHVPWAAPASLWSWI